MSPTTLFTKNLLIVASLALVACSKPVPSDEPVRAVKVLTVGVGSVQAGLEFAGEVRARVESRLGFRVGGKIVRRQAALGQQVKAGQVLAQLDAEDLKLALDAARAQVVVARTNRDLAVADYKRYKELREQNFVSGAELERRESTLKAAQAQLDQALAQATGQGNQATYANLVADVSGVVTGVDAEPGQVVQAGTSVVRVAQDGPREVVFAVPEDKLTLMPLGSSVEIQPWASTQRLQGQVYEVAASTDPVTRTFAVKVSLDAKDALPLGSTVTVFPKVPEHSQIPVIKLPTSALYKSGGGATVWVVNPSTMAVSLQPVQVASADGNEVIVTGGLQPGVQVVVAGVHVLAPGQKVSIYKEKTSPTQTHNAQEAMKSVAPSASAAVQK